MKKSISLLLAIVLAICTFCITGTSAAADTSTSAPSVRVNDLLVSFPDTQPYIDGSGHTMIPVRFVTEELGATVTWIEKPQTAIISLDGTTVQVPIGSKTIVVTKDGSTSTVTMDTQAVNMEGSTCVPIRYVAEALGAYVGYSDYYNTVEVCRETLTKDEITRLRAYGYRYYGGGRYIHDENGTISPNPDYTLSYYADYDTNSSFLDPDFGYDNAREYLLRSKESVSKPVVGKLTNTTWNVMDDDQARLYLNEAVALVNQYWSGNGIEADFTADTSCMYQDDYYDGFNYSCRGILNMTVTDTSSAAAQTILRDLNVTYKDGQTQYAIDFEAKVHYEGSGVVLGASYNLADKK